MPLGKEVATGMYVDFWAIPEESNKGEEAFQLLDFFLQEEQQRSGIMKGIPPLKSSALEMYMDRFPEISKEEMNVWFQGVNYGKTPAYFKGWSEFQNETTDILNRFGMKEYSLDEALDQICEAYEKQQ
jgi:ABC-type glycerol-3-phosphate transport system substrate-binding protein